MGLIIINTNSRHNCAHQAFLLCLAPPVHWNGQNFLNLQPLTDDPRLDLHNAKKINK